MTSDAKPEFMIPPPATPSLPRWFWQMITSKLIRQADRRTYWRVCLYFGGMFIATLGYLTAADPTGPSLVRVLLTMLFSGVQILFVSLAMDVIERRRLHNEWMDKELRAHAAKWLERQREEAETFRLGAIEAVSAHALAVQKRLEENHRRIDGEDWKQEGKES